MGKYFRFPCPKCGQRLKAKTKAVGHQVHCKKCGAQFNVPDPAVSKHDPATPRTPEASLAAAETDPAPMVLKDQTSINDPLPPPRGTTRDSVPPRKGCGGTLSLAGLIVVLGCSSLIGATRVVTESSGSQEPGTSGWPLLPILCTLLLLTGLGYVAWIGVMSVQQRKATEPKFTIKTSTTSTPANTKPPPVSSDSTSAPSATQPK